MSDEGEHTALYDDLTDAPITSIAAVTTAPVSTLFAGTQDPVLSDKLTHLEKRVKELEDENANLKRNIEVNLTLPRAGLRLKTLPRTR